MQNTRPEDTQRISRRAFKIYQLREQISDPSYASDAKTLEALAHMLERVMFGAV